MQNYLDHVERSRKRLRKIATASSKPKGSGVVIRGTALREPSVDTVLGKEREYSVPVYTGSPGFFGPGVRAALLDATLRKSISFAIRHLYDASAKARNASGIFGLAPFLSDESRAGRCDRLALVMVHIPHHDYSGEHLGHAEECRIGGTRAGCEFAWVGDEMVPTLLDRDWTGDIIPHMRSYQELREHLVVLPPSSLSQAARAATEERAIEETRRFIRNGWHLNLLDERYFAEDKDPLIEGFKRNRLDWAKEYRFAIEVEMAMMELMLRSLERGG